MEIEKNSRQVPKVKEYMAHKSYNDIVYAYLQVNSEFEVETGIRYIPKNQIKFVQIAEALGISRQTVSSKFKNMLDTKDGLGLIHFNEDKKRYELIKLDNSLAMLIPEPTLRKMTVSLSENSINVYAVLFNNWYRNNQKSYQITIGSIKEIIGLSNKTRSNDYIITDILEVLAQLGLITYSLDKLPSDDHYKTIYKIIKVDNKILSPDVKVGREVE